MKKEDRKTLILFIVLFTIMIALIIFVERPGGYWMDGHPTFKEIWEFNKILWYSIDDFYRKFGGLP